MYGEDSGEVTLFDTEYLRECSPSGTKEDGVELAVILEEDFHAFWDGEDGVAIGDIFEDLVVDVFG